MQRTKPRECVEASNAVEQRIALYKNGEFETRSQNVVV